MSFVYPTVGVATRPRSRAESVTSLTSVLSPVEEAISSLDDREWVVFAPEVSAGETASNILSTTSFGDEQSCGAYGGVDGGACNAEESFELPFHNGTGSFSTQRDVMERVNMWRLDQSQLVFSELQRLERKFFPVYEEASDTTTTRTPVQRVLSYTQGVVTNISSVVSLEDDVLDILFGDVKPPSPKRHKFPSHFERARECGPRDWDRRLLARLLKHRPTLSVIQRLLTLGFSNAGMEHVRSVSDGEAPSLFSVQEHFWDEESSSLSSVVVR